MRKKVFFCVVWTSQVLFRASAGREGRNRQKRDKKARKGQLPEREARHPLNAPFVTPPFAAAQVPKGPFRTKNTTTIAKIVNYYAVVFLLRPPDLLRRGPFSERESVCNSQENGVRTRCAAIVNHRAIVQILRVVNLLSRLSFLLQNRWTPEGFQKGF